MQNYSSMDKAALQEEYQKLSAAYEGYKAQGLKLNMARGKPGAEQLNVSNDADGFLRRHSAAVPAHIPTTA